MKLHKFTFLLFFIPLFLNAQVPVDVSKIDIVRDEFGVAHIFSKTNVEAVYGVAWSQCEDNFNVMQENIAVLRGYSGLINGKEGAVMDFICQVFEIDELVADRYEQDITPEMDALLEAYVSAINKYAELHPSEILIKKIFPVSKQDILQSYTFNFVILSWAILDLAKIADNKLDLHDAHGNLRSAGSNAMAFNTNKTSDGKSYLVANPHVPTEGAVNFWETSVHTEEGLDVFGVTFSGGGLFPFIGANRHLAWTMTTNSDDFTDVYELKMHPKKKDYYEYDGEWLKLEKKYAKLRVKIGPLVIPIRKKYYISKYGSALKNKSGYYAIRSNNFFNIRHAEQFYKMAMAKNYEDFWKVLEIQGHASNTVTYADDQNNIFHINNALMPVRDTSYDWTGILPGNTSKTRWSFDEITPVEDLIYIKNPKCGYVYNCNNTPFDCTAPEENPKAADYPKDFGILETNTARAKRFKELIAKHDKVDYETIKSFRDDIAYHSTDLNFRQALNFNDIFDIIAKYPELADVGVVLKKWNRSMDIDNKQATLIALLTMHVEKYLFSIYSVSDNILPEELVVEGLKFAKKFLLKNYGTLEVELGKVQKIVRGEKELPMYGSSQTLANCHTVKHGKDKIKLSHGDSFIMYAKYGKGGLEALNTINLYGNSAKPAHPHYADQMDMYAKQEVKKIELDVEKIRANAVKTYHPK